MWLAKLSLIHSLFINRSGIVGGGDILALRNITGLLSENEYRDFWVSWDNLNITVGTG